MIYVVVNPLIQLKIVSKFIILHFFSTCLTILPENVTIKIFEALRKYIFDYKDLHLKNILGMLQHICLIVMCKHHF